MTKKKINVRNKRTGLDTAKRSEQQKKAAVTEAPPAPAPRHLATFSLADQKASVFMTQNGLATHLSVSGVGGFSVTLPGLILLRELCDVAIKAQVNAQPTMPSKEG